MDLSVGAPRLDAVRAWRLYKHIIILEWDMRAQVNVGSDPLLGAGDAWEPPALTPSKRGGDGPERGRPTP